jgi:shikimate kinase
MIVTLIGYRATGKSSVAKCLSALLDWNWRDTDDEIQARTGKTIADLFSSSGESSFRELEETIIEELASLPSIVLSVGGGAVLSPSSRQRIRAAGPVIWLQAGPETILARMKQDRHNDTLRPSLTTLRAAEEVHAKLAERIPLYRAMADLAIDTEKMAVAAIADQIFSFVQPQLHLWHR